MLFAGLTANEHFASKVAHVDYRSVVSTVSLYSSVGLFESARFSVRKDGSIRYLGGPIGSVLYLNARFGAGRVAVFRDAAGEVLRLPLSFFGTPRLGHVASWCAARASLPMSSVVLGRSSTL